jgi:hypothetical protein
MALSKTAFWRLLVALIGGPLALVSVFFVGMLVWSGFITHGTEFKLPAVEHPLARMRVTQHHGKTDEVFVTLAAGVRLEQAVNLSLFEGFDPQMTVEAARARLGQPAGTWSDPFCRAPAPYYERGNGKVSLCRYATEFGGHRWDTIVYPRQCVHAYAFKDERMLRQVVPWLPTERAISVHVLRQVGWGGATVRMSRERCEWIVLSERES